MIQGTRGDGRRSGQRFDRSAIVMAVAFAAVFTWLMVRKHEAFNTRVYDLARFDQAIWNTLHGRFLYSTILNQSILGNHFSPYMALLSPLFLIWSDPRMLFLVQAVGMAVAGWFLYLIVRDRHPRLAPWFLLSFYLNPALHEMTLYEFRRITLAVPYLALALYALYARKRWLMLLGLGMALLCKEDIGFIVFMVGFFLLVIERDWKWGVPLMLLGGVWVVAISLWVIPLFAPAKESAPAVYPQLYYFDFLGESYGEIAQNLVRDPLVLVRQMVSVDRLLALGRLFLPLGIVLPFLAPGWAMICLPVLVYLLLSNEPVLYRLEKWHLAPVLPVLYAAIGVGLTRRSERTARWLVAVLGLTCVVGYVLFSPAPGGGTYDRSLYHVTPHHRLAAEIVAAVPAQARVAAQVCYVPHLAHREHIYHYPWIVIGIENIDYMVFDRYSNPYPFGVDGLNKEIDNILADPLYAVEMEADGIYLFRRGDPLPSIAVDRVADGTMRLERVDVAVQDDHGILRVVEAGPIQIAPGGVVRVSLYWEALAAPQAERTVSVRISNDAGAVVAQHDGLPGQGTKPTSWWEEGWQVRDVHYLSVPPQVEPGQGTLDIVVYDSQSIQNVQFDDGSERLQVCPVRLGGP
jgi:uncharacterized membrane protein